MGHARFFCARAEYGFIPCTLATPYNRGKGSVYLVFDFCEHDLAGLLSNSDVKFSLSEIKKLAQQLLMALFFIHRNKVEKKGRPPSIVHTIFRNTNYA